MSSQCPPSTLICLPSPVGFQVRNCLSAPTEKATLPSALTATPKTGCWWPGNVNTDSFASRSQTLAVLSRLPVNRCLPSGVKCDAQHPVGVVLDRSAPAWPSDPDRSHTRTARSQPPAASCLAVRGHGQAQHRIVDIEQIVSA